MDRIEMWGIYNVKFTGTGSEQRGVRPAIVVQNNIGNNYSPTVQVIPLTTQTKNNLPTHVCIDSKDCGLRFDSVALCEQLTICDKSRIGNYICPLPSQYIEKVVEGMSINNPVIAYLNETKLLMLFSNLQKRNGVAFAPLCYK